VCICLVLRVLGCPPLFLEVGHRWYKSVISAGYRNIQRFSKAYINQFTPLDPEMTTKSKASVKFDSKIIEMSGTYYLRLPKELVDYLESGKDEKIDMQSEVGPHGKYVSAWNPKAQEKKNQ